jgi:hypothetical protein
MICLGASRWELHPGTKCADCHPYPSLRDRFWARTFVRNLMTEPLAATAIRQLLSREVHPWPLPRTTADDATEQLASLLNWGLWHVHAPALPKDNGGASGESDGHQEEEKDIAEIVRAPARRPEPAARPKPIEEEGSLPRTADEAAIANGMKLASRLGIPFCEECAKAALKRAREAAVA